jgi:hypothetical protein
MGLKIGLVASAAIAILSGIAILWFLALILLWTFGAQADPWSHNVVSLVIWLSLCAPSCWLLARLVKLYQAKEKTKQGQEAQQ